MTNYNVFQLARLAECGDPDNAESPGAAFLASVQDSVNEQRGYADGGVIDPDIISEIADSAPDVYTHTLWSEFVDLQAYQEDPTELGCDASDMEQCARVCLYIIAERLAQALVADDAE